LEQVDKMMEEVTLANPVDGCLTPLSQLDGAC
jgi:hypothetical protein